MSRSDVDSDGGRQPQMDILIVKLGALGDVINTLPLAIVLKQQIDARIHWVTAPLSYPLLCEHEAVDRAILFDRRDNIASTVALLRELRSRKFDLVFDLQRILKSGLICLAAKGKRKIGFDRRRCKELTWLLPFERIPGSDPNAHMVHQYLDFAYHLGLKEQKVDWRIGTKGEKPKVLSGKYVVLNIGATKPANRWLADGFVDLVRMLQRRHHVPCVLTGGPEDIPMARRIEDALKGSVCNLVGKTSLTDLIGVINGAAVVVTCDTGPMHLAVALGKRVVALFGPSDHHRTGPFNGKVIRAKMNCAPCGRKACPEPLCMEAIHPESVLAVVAGCLR